MQFSKNDEKRFCNKKFDPLISKKVVPGQDIPKNEKINKKYKICQLIR